MPLSDESTPSEPTPRWPPMPGTPAPAPETVFLRLDPLPVPPAAFEPPRTRSRWPLFAGAGVAAACVIGLCVALLAPSHPASKPSAGAAGSTALAGRDGAAIAEGSGTPTPTGAGGGGQVAMPSSTDIGASPSGDGGSGGATGGVTAPGAGGSAGSSAAPAQGHGAMTTAAGTGPAKPGAPSSTSGAGSVPSSSSAGVPGSGPTTTSSPGKAPTTTTTASKPTVAPTTVSTGCTGWTFKNNSAGTAYMAGAHHMNSGPYEACTQGALVPVNQLVYYWCYVDNAWGNRWIYVRVSGTNTAGWMSAANLTRGSGSLNHC